MSERYPTLKPRVIVWAATGSISVAGGGGVDVNLDKWLNKVGKGVEVPITIPMIVSTSKTLMHVNFSMSGEEPYLVTI